MKVKELGLVFGMFFLIWIFGYFFTYPPYAKLSALLFLLLAFGVLALREREIEKVSKESLKGETGESSKSLRKGGGKEKRKNKKGKRKKTKGPK